MEIKQTAFKLCTFLLHGVDHVRLLAPTLKQADEQQQDDNHVPIAEALWDREKRETVFEQLSSDLWLSSVNDNVRANKPLRLVQPHTGWLLFFGTCLLGPEEHSKREEEDKMLCFFASWCTDR
ncbi:hypothetical protein INR49_016654 [Caranx melampygus]|nr:hypothetical protein INR49_016654 [Caranx melampygus]